jgi:hypothetical protein
MLVILGHVDKNIEHYIKSGVLEQLVNNTLLKELVDSINYDDDNDSYNNQMKMLLEVHLKVEAMYEKARQLGHSKLNSIIENSEGIISVKSSKVILQEKNKFELLKYVIH